VISPCTILARSCSEPEAEPEEATVMEALAVLFVATITLTVPAIALVVLIVLHRRHRELTARTNQLQHELTGTKTDLRNLEAKVWALAHDARPEKKSRIQESKTVEDRETVEPIDARDAPGVTDTIGIAGGTGLPAASAVAETAAPRRTGLERQLGTKVAVWVGAVALTFAGIFLVKYTIEQGLIGPAARVVLGFVFGMTLLITAEWMRRRSAGVAQGLAASGIAVLFAVLLAGVKLYELIPPAAGFLGMLLTTATAVVLSVRHGQMVAILGLLGGFLTPLFIGGEAPRPGMLFTYLVLIQTGLLIISRKMRWWPVAGLSLLGGMGWGALWIADIATLGGGTFPVGLFLLVSALSYVLLAAGMGDDESMGGLNIPLSLVWGGVGISLLLVCILVGVGDFGLLEWTFLGILGAGCLVLGRRDTRFEGLPWLAALMSAGMLLVWGIELEAFELTQLWWIAAILGALYVGGSYLAMWGSKRPERWAALSGVSAVVHLLVAYAISESTGDRFAWGAICLGIAAVLCSLAIPVAKRRNELSRGDDALTVFAVAVTALISLAVPMELKREWIGIAWALEIPALSWAAARLRLPALVKLAWGLGGLVAVRLLLNPSIFSYPMGDGVVFNWLLYGYGLPIVAFAAGSLLTRRLPDELLSRALAVGSILLGLAYVSLSVRQAFHPGDIGSTVFYLNEWGAFTVSWLLFALGMLTLHGVAGRALYLNSAAIISVVALAQGLAIQGLVESPLLNPHPVGALLILNRILFVFGVPAILGGLMAWRFARIGEPVAARLTGGGALAFAFVTLTLEVRQAFHGSLLNDGATSNAEMYSYSLVWVLFATVLLVAGILSRGTVLRYASAVVMTLAVGKVFLVDTGQLQDLYRVFSLLGLGVSLMLLAYLYQRFVFGAGRR
jgi:uncharacterized membrane protein